VSLFAVKTAGFGMEEGYELDLTYITERIIAVSFPRGCTEEIYSHNLKDVTRMLKSKHADNYLIINLSEKRHDLTKMNPKTLDTGWPDMHAPPLDKICTICKAMESWLNADPLHVVVIHCRGGKGRIGVVISSFVHFTDVSASADQALDRFAMRKYYDDKVSALMTPSQKRYVWILNSLLSGSMKINASPLFLHCVILHGIPNFDLQLPMNIQKKKAFSKFLTSVLIVVITLMYFLLQIKCYHKGDVTSDREVIFRLQFHTGAVQGYNLMFEKEDMETANKDPRFADYGKVELVFSEGPERIPGRFLTLLDADRWQNGADVIVDYNTADPLIRWDSYQNICDGEGLTQDKAANKRSPSGGEATLGRGARTTSATSSPDHSDHALSVSSDSGLSSTSLWADRPTPVPTPTTTTTTTIRPNQGPSQQEKVQLKRLLSGFGLDDPSLREMGDQGPIVGIQQIVPAQVHINGDPRPRERETDILDDEVITGHDLHSVDSLGTLSSSCHKSSQNSLLSDGFGSPGGEEQQSQSQHHLHHPAHPPMEEYERAYAEARRGCLSSRSNSVASANPSSAPMPKQHVYRQGSYSTQSWVRQQQMVAAQQFIYMAEDGNETERYPGNKQGSSSPKAGLLTEPQGLSRDMTTDAMTNTAPHNKQATMNNNNNNKRDEEFKSLTMDIDNSIDQLNQLIMDLDPTFAPVSSHSSSIKRNGGTHVNGSVSKCSNGINLRFNDNNAATLKNTQVGGDRGVQGSADILPLCAPVSGKYSVCTQCIMALSPFMNHFILYGWLHVCVCCLLQHPLLYRTDSVDYRGPDMDSGVEAGSDMTPPTPAFPISPPTPYGKYCMFPVKQPPPHSMSLDYGHHSPPLHHPHIHPAPNAHSSPRSSQRSCMARYALSRSPAQSFDEQDDSGHGYGTDCPNTNSNLLGNGGMDRELLTSMDGLTQLQLPQMLPPVLPEKKRASDGEHSLGTASPALSGFSSPHSGSSLSIPFPNVLPDLSAQALGTASPLPGNKQVTVKFVQDTSKYWYKPDISRDQAISVLKDKDPGCFIVRDSHSFRGAYGLAMKVATPPPSVLQQTKKGGDLSNELVRHFLIECTQKGVRLKGCPNEPYFGSLTALVCQHSITPLALPCKLIIPDRDPLEDVVETTSQLVTNSAAELLKQGAACNVWYLGSVEMESLTGAQAVQKATSMSLSANPPPTSTVVHFKVSSQGITLTDNQRKLFFRRHYNVNTVIFCALDPQDRKWNKDGCPSAKIFGFVARKTGTSMDNVCHLFAEHDPEQPASAIVNFVSKVMIGSQKSK
uniref:Tensin 3 n=1 Tax=Sander lucioperca TaxID=283035 RepID=A0A8C9XGH2_SANLU